MTQTPRRKCFVYIDGFNFYYGIFKDKPEWKWLDISKFCKSLRSLEVVSVRYFTAVIDEEISYSPKKDRQQKFLSALRTTPDLEIIYGKFQPRLSRCRATCCEEYSDPKEKKTDVNIAVRMMDDCITDKPDTIILISSDSDLEPAVAWVHRVFPEIEIIVYLPNLPGDPNPRRNDYYGGIGVPCGDLPCGRIPDSQFRTAVRLSENPLRVACRPDEWVAEYVEPN